MIEKLVIFYRELPGSSISHSSCPQGPTLRKVLISKMLWVTTGSGPGVGLWAMTAACAEDLGPLTRQPGGRGAPPQAGRCGRDSVLLSTPQHGGAVTASLSQTLSLRDRREPKVHRHLWEEVDGSLGSIPGGHLPSQQWLSRAKSRGGNTNKERCSYNTVGGGGGVGECKFNLFDRISMK